MTFEDFWKIYPRRIAKGAARKAWERAVKIASPEEIIAGVDGLLANLPSEMQFVPHASTWLNQERWADEYTALPSKSDMIAAALKAKWERESNDKQNGSTPISDKALGLALPFTVGEGKKPH